MKISAAAIGLLAVIGSSAAAEMPADKHAPQTFRYKITLVADVDGTEKSTSGVGQVERLWSQDGSGAWSHSEKITSEAVFLDLGKRTDGRDLNLVFTLWGRNFGGQGWPQTWPYWGAPTEHPATADVPRFDVFGAGTTVQAADIDHRTLLPIDHWPLLMSFPDVTDPNSVIEAGVGIQPQYPIDDDRHWSGKDFASDDLAGQGKEIGREIGDERVRLLAIYVEPTDDPVTTTLASQLKWVPTLPAPINFTDQRIHHMSRSTFALD